VQLGLLMIHKWMGTTMDGSSQWKLCIIYVFLYLFTVFIYLYRHLFHHWFSQSNCFPKYGYTVTVNLITSYNQQRMGLLDGSDHWAWENLLWFYLVPVRWGSQMSCIFVDGHVFSPTLVTIIGIYMYSYIYIYVLQYVYIYKGS
jgi:hypothetical protein